MLLLADGQIAAYAGGRIAAPHQTEVWRMPADPDDLIGSAVRWIQVAQVAPWRPETLTPLCRPLLACQQPRPAWQASPLNPRRHKPDGIRAGAPTWPSREQALRAAAAGAIVQARRCRRITGPARAIHGIRLDTCRRVIAWARGVAGLPAEPRGYESIDWEARAAASDTRETAMEPHGQMMLFEEMA